MTQFPKRRRKKRRFYWVELGFLVLGLIGLRPEILTELFPNNPPAPTANFYSPVQTLQQAPYPPPPQPSAPYRPDPNFYDPSRIASNPSQVTSRYAGNPAYPSQFTPGYPPNAYPVAPAGPSSSTSSQPPVAWPEGYEPNPSNYYRR